MHPEAARSTSFAAGQAVLIALGLIVGLVAAASPRVRAQQSTEDLLKIRKVTLHADRSMLEEVVGLLMKESGVAIEMEEGIEESEVSGRIDDRPLGEALRILLGTAGLKYEARDDYVMVIRDPDAPPPPPEEELPPPEKATLEDLLREGEYEQAEGRIRKEIEARPEDLPLKLLLGSVLRETGRYDAAVEHLEEVARAAPEEKEVRLRLGRLYLRTGRYEEAEEHLKACGDLPSARTALGILYIERLGRREEGRKILQELVDSISPRDPRADALLAAAEAHIALRHQDSQREASGYFSRAVDQDPDRAEPYLGLAGLWLSNFEQAEAVRIVEKGLERRPSLPEGRVLYAKCILMNHMLGTGRYPRAMAEVKRALEVNPSFPEAHLFLAEIAIFDGRYDKAREHIDTVLDVNPRSIPGRARLAAIAYLRDDLEEARAREEEVLKDNPRAYRFYVDIAEIIEDRFRYREAADLARKAIELEPESGEAYHILGTNLIRLGKMEEGEAAIVEAQKRDTNLFVRNTLTVLRELRENYETILTPHFVIRIHKSEVGVLAPYVMEILEEARTSLGERYGFLPEERILCEVYIDANSFSTRVMGLPWAGLVGVCFGPVMAIDSPTALKRPARAPGDGKDDEKDERASFSWARTLWHEYTHVVTLLATDNRIPRWFTEGLAVLEESRARAHWSREGEMATTFFTALEHGLLLGVGELDRGFTKPEFGGQVLLSYYQGARVCEYIEERYGLEALRGLIDGYKRSMGTGAVFEEVLGIDLETFDKDFLEHSRKWMESTGFQALPSLKQLVKLKEAYRASPQDASLATALARAYFGIHKVGEAELYAAKAVELDPNLGDAQAIVGWVRLARGARGEAESALELALELGCRDRLRVHRGLARIAAIKKDTAAVYEHLSAIHELLPMDAKTSRSLAKIRLDADAEDAAIPHLEAAVRWDPADLESRLELLEIYIDKGQDKRVIDMGWQIIALDPIRADLHFPLGEALRREGRGREALREYDVALALGDFHEEEIACAQAELHLEAGDHDKARERAQRALEIRPGSERAEKVMEILKSEGSGGEER